MTGVPGEESSPHDPFEEAYEDETIVSTLSRQLRWSHFLDLIYINELLKRYFYTEICRLERWSVRTLRAKLDGMCTSVLPLEENRKSWQKRNWRRSVTRTG